MAQTIRRMAVATLVLQAVLTYVQLTHLATNFPYGPYGPQPTVGFLIATFLQPFLAVTGQMLAFALGVVALVAATRARRRRWFAGLVALTILVGYESILSPLLYTIIYLFAQRSGGAPPDVSLVANSYLPLLTLAPPAALALAALTYTRPGSASLVELSGSPSDAEMGDSQDVVDADDAFEVTSLDRRLDVTL